MEIKNVDKYLKLLNEWKQANENNDIERMKELGEKILELEEGGIK